MIKKLLKLTLSAALALLYTLPTTAIVYAENSGDNPCGNINSADDVEKCKAYQEELAASNKELASKLADINAQRAEIAANIEAYNTKITDYQKQLDELTATLNDLNAKIDELQLQIDDTQAKADAKQADIDATNAQIEAIGAKVKDRMVSNQSSMRLNTTFDVLMGASTFEDLLRIFNGYKYITERDNETTTQLISLTQTLKADKQILDGLKQDLENQQAEIEEDRRQADEQKQQVAVAQAEIQVIKDAAEDQAALLESQGETYAADINSIKSQIANGSAEIEAYQERINKQNAGQNTDDGNTDIPSASNGWTFPVPGSYRSAGTWNYPGGGVHLGYDFAARQGTTILAAASGYVLKSADGCNSGYLGSSCHGFGGSNGGGNQVYLLVTVGSNLYAMKYLHMQYGSPIAQGQWVSAGQAIGRVGATGNVTGPHSHIEIFYLGSASNFSYYLNHWNGDLSFGTGWAHGSYGTYGRRCDAGAGAPCRIRPEAVF